MISFTNKIEDLILTLNNLKPLKAEFQSKLDKKFRLEFNYNSNHLEGNTLSYAETELLLIFEDTVGNHTLREYQEMQAHDVALGLIKEWSTDKEHLLSEVNIKNLNKIILVKPFWKDAITYDGQKTRRQIKVGDYKEFPNSVLLDNGEKFDYASVIDTPILMGELVSWYRNEEQKLAMHPVQLAALLHYKFVRIHPFDDGNGRISRLLMNYVLLKHDLPPVVIKSTDKRNYLSALHKADSGNVNAFVEYIERQLIWSLELSIKAARGENIEEPNDIDKEISLLEREMKSKTSKVEIAKSKEAILNIFDDSIVRFYKKFISECEKFDRFYNEGKFFLRAGYDGSEDKNTAIIKIREAIDENLQKLEFDYTYLHFKNHNYEDLNFISSVIFGFNSSGYILKLERSNGEINKTYSQQLSEAEIDKILKIESDRHLKTIKEMVEKL
ncbi:MAG: Fic family protein [Pseudomonadota bacterium]